MTSKEAKGLLNFSGIPYKEFRFSGTCHGTGKGFPHVEGSYKTVRYGQLDYFYKGEEEVDGWKKIYEYRQQGCACTPSLYITIYVPEKYWERAKELLGEAPIRREIPKHSGSCA